MLGGTWGDRSIHQVMHKRIKMARKGVPKRKHKRTSVKGRRFVAGRGLGKQMSKTKKMTKARVKSIERIAKALMIEDDKIIESLGSVGETHLPNLMRRYDYRIYDKLKRVLRQEIVHRNLSNVYYHIFEDANYHLLNQSFVGMDAFVVSQPWRDNREYKEYLKFGGRTWTLTG